MYVCALCVCPLCHFFAFNNSQHKSKSMSYIMKGNGGLAVKNLFRLNDLFKQFKKRERSVCVKGLIILDRKKKTTVGLPSDCRFFSTSVRMGLRKNRR